MSTTPLVIGEVEVKLLSDLRERAAAEPIDMQEVLTLIQTPEGLREHRIRMGKLTVTLPVAYDVTFSVEHGHPPGTMRHMSMSVMKKGRVPNFDALWMVAEHLGFVGGLDACHIYPEEFPGGVAINVIQPVSVLEAAHA